MKFKPPLIEATLIKRYKRFLVDVKLSNGNIITAHTANTGAMTGCAKPGSRVWLSVSDNPKRKYPHSWELVEVDEPEPTMLGINTQKANTLVEEAINNKTVEELQGYKVMRREVKYGNENSRIDVLLENPDVNNPEEISQLSRCYVEVKSVTLVEDGIAYFPDAVTKRGAKHLRELATVVNQGCRAVIFYCVQRQGVNEVRAAKQIDPDYFTALQYAVAAGVETLAYSSLVTPDEIRLKKRVPVIS